MKIGVLDIQGSVGEHFAALEKVEVEPVLVKNVEDLGSVGGLILPGGESTTMGMLLRRFGLRDAIVEKTAAGMPLWGTCAGAILMARNIVGKELTEGLGLMDIIIERNAYGRQANSFETEIEFIGKKVPAIFIRAPKIIEIGDEVEILASYDGEVIAAVQKNLLATSFHPELTNDLSVHQYFAGMCG